MAGRILPIALLGLVAVGTQTWLLPVLNLYGVTRSVTNLNHENCRQIAGLEACEDQWIHRESGISYLPCSSIKARGAWTPALDVLDKDKIAQLPGDTIKLFDTNTGEASQVTIENRPSHLANLHLHAIDAWIDPKDSEKLTFFINNHGVPAEGDPHKVGADSTVEIFETRLGSKTWRHVQTVRHPLVLTPNNIVSTGPRSFYVSNDHFHKTSFKRILPLYRLPGSAGAASSVVHCEATSGTSVCIEAATGIQYPNGIAKGPDSSIYVASTALGEIKQFHMQADKTLTEGDLVADVKRAIDNIQVDEKGGIIVATIPKAIDFIKRAKTGEGLSAAEVWRVRNETSDQKFYGKRYTTELIFADADGSIASGMTNAHLYKGKLYLTGLTTPSLAVCEHPSFKL